MTDEEVIEYFATVRPADPLPPGGQEQLRIMLFHLGHLGIIPLPQETDLVWDVLRRARAACRALRENADVPHEYPSA